MDANTIDRRTRRQKMEAARKVVSASDAAAAYVDTLTPPVVVPAQATSSLGSSPARPISKRREEMLQKMNSIKRTNSSGSQSTSTSTTEEVPLTVPTSSNTAVDSSLSSNVAAAVRRSVSQRNIEKIRRSTSALQSRSSDASETTALVEPVVPMAVIPTRRASLQRANSGRQLKAAARSEAVPSEKADTPVVQRHGIPKRSIRPEHAKERHSESDAAVGLRVQPPTPERKVKGNTSTDTLDSDASHSKLKSQVSAPKPELRSKLKTPATDVPNGASAVTLSKNGTDPRSGRRSRYHDASKTVAASRLYATVTETSAPEQLTAPDVAISVIHPVKAEVDLKSGKRAFMALQQKRSLSVPHSRPSMDESSMISCTDSQQGVETVATKANLPAAREKFTMEMKRAKLVKSRVLVKDAPHTPSSTQPVDVPLSATLVVPPSPERTATDVKKAKVNKARTFLKEFPPTEPSATETSEAAVPMSSMESKFVPVPTSSVERVEQNRVLSISWTEKRTRALQVVGGRRSLGNSSLSVASESSLETLSTQGSRLTQGASKLQERYSAQVGIPVSAPSPEQRIQPLTKRDVDEKPRPDNVSLPSNRSQKKATAREIVKRRASRTSLDSLQTNLPSPSVPSMHNDHADVRASEVANDQPVQDQAATVNEIPPVSLCSDVEKDYFNSSVAQSSSNDSVEVERIYTVDALDSELVAIEAHTKEHLDKTATFRADSPELSDKEIAQVDKTLVDEDTRELDSKPLVGPIARVSRGGNAHQEYNDLMDASIQAEHVLFDDTGQCVTIDDAYTSVCEVESQPMTVKVETSDVSESFVPTGAIGPSSRKCDTCADIPSEALQNITSLDFSSIAPTSLEASAIVEPTWDTLKVMFNEFDRAEGKGNEDDHFKSILKDLEAEEKKDSASPVSKFHPAVASGELDPLGWPRHSVGLVDDASSVPDEKTRVDAMVDESIDLLVRVEDEGSPPFVALSPSKDVRILSYETMHPGDSDSDESDDDSQPEEESDEEEVAIGYVSQDSDDEDDYDPPLPSSEAALYDTTAMYSVQTIQPFTAPTETVCPTVAVVEAIVREDSVNHEMFNAELLVPTSHNVTSDSYPANNSESIFPHVSFVHQIPPPPPPPPPPGHKKPKRQSRRMKDNSGEAVPLLPPPPDAKLKLWEESKAAQSRHGFNGTASNPSIVEARNLESSQQDGSDEASEKRQEATCVLDPSNDPEILRKAFSDLSLSPLSSSLVLQDARLAEKVDQAMVAASNKFEQQIELAHTQNGSGSAIAEMKAELSCGVLGQFPSVMAELENDQEGTSEPNDAYAGSTGALEREEATRALTPTETDQIGDDSVGPSRRSVVPKVGPSAFTLAVVAEPAIIAKVLECLGDPVAVCRMKMVNKTCFHYVDTNEHTLMRDAVRLGGMNMNVRPYFWLWVTLNMSKDLRSESSNDPDANAMSKEVELTALERQGREGKWHHVIQRDVSRAFGTLPPHKTGARLRTDSIVRALITWGKSRVMKRGVKGNGDGHIRSNTSSESDDVSLSPTDTVSDWGGVTPVGSFSGSFTSSNSGQAHGEEAKTKSRRATDKKAEQKRVEELALNGNALTDETKALLQQKLSFILHALAAAHPDVGYCQGMDYLVAHLLRILQDTIRWKVVNGTMPRCIRSTPIVTSKPPSDGKALSCLYADIDRSLVVEETCFRVMDSFFTVYNLAHFYWPELRCLKTCCRVLEKIVQIKLPVLADHFEHHELNVGLFALGWFQTLFLYLPSMPSATVCHMWDIWLVERSFKIFFRVGTAILFLSQPTLLNHELEGMMSYLNTFPDATLLSPDILIACALQIKITNRMLMDLEQEVKESTLTC